MYQKNTGGWLKHLDFILIDLLLLQISYILAFFTRHHERYDLAHSFQMVYHDHLYLTGAIVLAVSGLAFSVMTENHKDILKRGYLIELKEVLKQAAACTVFLLIYLFFTQTGEQFSRLTVAYFMGYSVILLYTGRMLWKQVLFHRGVSDNRKRHILLITVREHAASLARKLKTHEYGNIDIIGMVLADGEGNLYKVGEMIEGVMILCDMEHLVNYMQERWIDEVLIQVPKASLEKHQMEELEEIRKDILMMGLTTHEIIDYDPESSNMRTVEDVAGFECLTESVRIATPRQLFIKRLMDIAGGLVGMGFTAILTIIIGPMIKIADPKGGIFFKQIRVGRNGRRFPIYKFRSMYTDAEERKKELMKLNKTGDSKLFKVDNDPRILGSGPDGTRHGIGWFIRRTSLDEFPQFWSVLIGDMSLVGTRPPTEDEWENYDLHHRARLAIKPGLTGLWQVSGRSKITDFEEVVALDMKYINNWSIREDIKIILKTVKVMITGDGAE